MTNLDANEVEGIWHTNSQSSNVAAAQTGPSFSTEQRIPYLEEDTLEELEGPRSWLLPALASAIFCFLPTGAAAVYLANKARKAYEDGDLRAWTRYTARARFLVFVTCIAGLVVYGAIIGLVHAVRHVHYT